MRSPAHPRFAALILAALAILALAPVTEATSYASVATHGSRLSKTIALTFDDGWGTANCAKVVNILEATKTPATFFPNAKWVQAAPTFWRKVAALGFPIAHHTTHHYQLTGLSYAAQFKEIDSDRRIVEPLLGIRMTRVLRPPYGAYNTNTRIASYAAGFHLMLNWDVSFADSSRRADGTLWPYSSYLRAATKGTNGSVILGHCGSPVDYVILKSVISHYRALGFRFVTVPQMFGLSDSRVMTFPSTFKPF